MIELKTYSTEELKEVLNISKRQWDERREETLEHMKFFFDYEIVHEGRHTYYNIKEQYGEYEALPRRKKSEEIKAYYYAETREIVKEKPWNSGRGVARNIIARGENIYNHALNTMAGYTAKIVKEKFVIPLSDSVWMKQSADKLDYLPLEPHELEYLEQLFAQNSKENLFREEMEKFAEYQSGYISKDDLKDFLLGNVQKSYGWIMDEFKEEFGFIPLKIKMLQEKVGE